MYIGVRRNGVQSAHDQAFELPVIIEHAVAGVDFVAEGAEERLWAQYLERACGKGPDSSFYCPLKEHHSVT
jgi:hypothetical protein